MLIDISAVAPGIEPVTGSISLNGGAAERFSRTPAEGGFTAALPIGSAVAVGQEMSVELQIQNPRVPIAYDGSKDSRPLGLLVRRVSVEPPAL